MTGGIHSLLPASGLQISTRATFFPYWLISSDGGSECKGVKTFSWI